MPAGQCSLYLKETESWKVILLNYHTFTKKKLSIFCTLGIRINKRYTTFTKGHIYIKWKFFFLNIEKKTFLPGLDQRNINGPPSASRSQIEWPGCPQQGNAIGCVVSVKGCVLKEWLHKLWQFKLLIIFWQWLRNLQHSKGAHYCTDTFWIVQK